MSYEFHFGDVFAYSGLLLRGTWLTIQLTVLSTVFGLAVGVAGAVGRNSTMTPVRWLAGA
jgi:polar amino acid transport system permease protein